jgi:hypothetical protein
VPTFGNSIDHFLNNLSSNKNNDTDHTAAKSTGSISNLINAVLIAIEDMHIAM